MASDYAENSGEGNLARLFTKFLIEREKYWSIIVLSKHMNEESFFPKKFIRRIAKSSAKISVT